MKATIVGLVSAALLGACATQENTPEAGCSSQSVGCEVSGGTGGAANSMAGNAGATMSGGGSNPTAGAPTAGGEQGGGSSAGAAQAGSSGTGTSGGAPAGGGAAPAAGASAGGAPGAGAPGAGAPGAGAPGAGAPGAGAGGAANAGCTKAIPARTAWVGGSSGYSGDGTGVCSTKPTDPLCNKPEYAFDASLSTRFSTGAPQAGTEYLLIDFGTAKATVSQVTVNTTNNDFGKHIQIRMSDSATDATSMVLAEQIGMTGILTFNFTPTTARYLRIMQTGVDATGDISWWSVYDVTASCAQ